MKKKILSLGIVIALCIALITLTGCGDEAKNEKKDKKDKKEENTVEVELSEQEIDAFNAQFDSYIDDEITGTGVKSLITSIVSSNMVHEDDDLAIIVELDGEVYSDDEISDIKTEIKATSKYEVTADYSKDGYIERIIIDSLSGSTSTSDTNDSEKTSDNKTDKKTTEESSKSNTSSSKSSDTKDASDAMSQAAKSAFNAQFESYVGESKSANDVKALLTTVVSSNSSSENVVVVEKDGTEYTDSSDIASVKNKIAAAKKFNVTADYKDGVIVKITIK